MNTRDPQHRSKRLLGSGFTLAVTIGGIIGLGILRTPGEVAAVVSDLRALASSRASGLAGNAAPRNGVEWKRFLENISTLSVTAHKTTRVQKRQRCQIGVSPWGLARKTRVLFILQRTPSDSSFFLGHPCDRPNQTRTLFPYGAGSKLFGDV